MASLAASLLASKNEEDEKKALGVAASSTALLSKPDCILNMHGLAIPIHKIIFQLNSATIVDPKNVPDTLDWSDKFTTRSEGAALVLALYATTIEITKYNYKVVARWAASFVKMRTQLARALDTTSSDLWFPTLLDKLDYIHQENLHLSVNIQSLCMRVVQKWYSEPWHDVKRIAHITLSTWSLLTQSFVVFLASCAPFAATTTTTQPQPQTKVMAPSASAAPSAPSISAASVPAPSAGGSSSSCLAKSALEMANKFAEESRKAQDELAKVREELAKVRIQAAEDSKLALHLVCKIYQEVDRL
jgi:hypothetical protein